MGELAREIFCDRIPADRMDAFVRDFAAYRLDEVLGAWKPYDQVLCNAVERSCKRWGIAYVEAEGRRFYDAVPSWGPHADVPEPLARVAKHVPLVILSNAMDDQIHANVEKLGAPFTPSVPPSRRRPTSPAFRPSNTCSTSSAARPRTCCTSRRA